MPTPQIKLRLIVEGDEIYKIIGEAADNRTTIMDTDTIRIISQDKCSPALQNLYPQSDIAKRTYYSINNIIRDLLGVARTTFREKPSSIEISLNP